MKRWMAAMDGIRAAKRVFLAVSGAAAAAVILYYAAVWLLVERVKAMP